MTNKQLEKIQDTAQAYWDAAKQHGAFSKKSNRAARKFIKTSLKHDGKWKTKQVGNTLVIVRA